MSEQVFPAEISEDPIPDYVTNARAAFMGGVVFSVSLYSPLKKGEDPRVAIMISTPDELTDAVELHVAREVIDDALERHRRLLSELDDIPPDDEASGASGTAGSR